jgi:hypothetical protein
MKSDQSQERFENALRQILQVSKTDLNRMMEEEKQANTGKPKRGPKPKVSISDHASEKRD